MELRGEMMVAGAAEGARRASAAGPAGAISPVPDPAVDERPKRRRFTAEYKLRILREADRCKSGELGALLRREGLYSSHLAHWRHDRDRAAKAVLTARKRGPKPAAEDPRIKQLEREKARLERRLRRAEIIIDFQKKLSVELGIPMEHHEIDESDE